MFIEKITRGGVLQFISKYIKAIQGSSSGGTYSIPVTASGLPFIIIGARRQTVTSSYDGYLIGRVYNNDYAQIKKENLNGITNITFNATTQCLEITVISYMSLLCIVYNY